MLKVNESRILIVDDEPANLQLLERLLETEGYSNVLAVGDPRDVALLWDAYKPDLLLLDLMMPYLNGFTVMQQLKDDGSIGNGDYVPIMVLTADATSQTLDRALTSGANDFLTKPFDHNEVQLRVRNLLETRALHVALAESNVVLERTVRERTEHLSKSLADLKSSREETIKRSSIACELRDDDTGRHIQRMSRYCGILASAVGLNEAGGGIMEMASQMHDVGKIGIPDAVLMKPGKLDPEERVIMEQHAKIGYGVLSGSDSDLLILAASIALTHHEWVDGGGYPRGLAGHDIPIEGRIAAIADVFDALTNNRVYRPRFPVRKALEIMEADRGTHFDPDLLDMFVKVLPEILEAQALFGGIGPSDGQSP